MTAIASWQVLLDCRMLPTSASYSGGTGLTTFTMPAPCFASVVVSLSDAKSHALTQLTTTTLSATGDLSSGQCVLGTPAPLSVELSQIIPRDVYDKPEFSPGALMQRLTVFHLWSTGFDIQVSTANPTQWPTYTRSWSPDLTADAYTPFNRFRIGINQPAGRTLIRILETSFKPVAISGIDVDIEAQDGIR